MNKSPPDNDVAFFGKYDQWSVGTGQLTAKGGAELLRQFGAKLERCYEQIIEEPLPYDLKVLLAKLDGANETGTERH